MEDQPEEIQTTRITLPSYLTSRVPQLSSLLQTVTCNICYDPLTRPVTTPNCQHTFCSLCIRKSLQYRQVCPSCHKPALESGLRQNRTAETVLNLIQPLVTSIENLAQFDHQKENTDPVLAINPKKTGILCRDNGQHDETLSSVVESEDQTENEGNNTDENMTISEDHKRGTISVEKSSCTVCKVDVPILNLNHHLDRCFKSKDVSDAPLVVSHNIPTQYLPPLPKVVYALLKEPQLRKKCREIGLDAKGDRQMLVNRLKRFTLLYNNEAGMERPRSRVTLVRQVEKEEREETTGRVEQNILLQYNKNTEEKVREEKQKQYLKENKGTFGNLLQQVRDRAKRNKITKENVKVSTPDENKEDALECKKSGNGTATNINLVLDIVEKLEEASVNNIVDLTQPEPTVTPLEYPEQDDRADNGKRNLSSSSQGEDKVYVKKLKRESMDESEIKEPTFKIGTPKDKLSKFKKSLKLGKKNLKTINIIDQMARSSEKSKLVPKVNCPVCNSLVTEKWLNIHLDKCLGNTSSSTSPVIPKNKKRTISSQETLTFSEDEDDVCFPSGSSVRWMGSTPKVAEGALVQMNSSIEVHSKGNLENVDNEIEKQVIIESVGEMFGSTEVNYVINSCQRDSYSPLPPSPSLLATSPSPPTSPQYNKYSATQQVPTSTSLQAMSPSPPPSPQFKVAQQQVFVSQTVSEPDMFESDDDKGPVDDVTITNICNDTKVADDLVEGSTRIRPVSGNMLELDADIEALVETALTEINDKDKTIEGQTIEIPSTSVESQTIAKRKSIRVVPRIREKKTLISSTQGSNSSLSQDIEGLSNRTPSHSMNKCSATSQPVEKSLPSNVEVSSSSRAKLSPPSVSSPVIPSSKKSKSKVVVTRRITRQSKTNLI